MIDNDLQPKPARKPTVLFLVRYRVLLIEYVQIHDRITEHHLHDIPIDQDECKMSSQDFDRWLRDIIATKWINQDLDYIASNRATVEE